MKRIVSTAAALALAACATEKPVPATPPPPPNPFQSVSALPFELPPFDRIQDSDYRSAFEAGMAGERFEIDRIAHDPAPPTFDNTIVAMERAGQMLDRVSTTFFNLNTANTDAEMQKIQVEMAPKLAAHSDAILLDPALFARVDAVYQQRASLNLDPESAQLLERRYTAFLRAGAKLADPDKETLKQLNQRISTLTTQFQQNVLAATKASAIVVDDLTQLDGLSPSQISAAAEAAKLRNLDGRWVLTLQNTTTQPVLTNLRNRGLRQRVYEASVARAQGGDADNTAVVAEIVRLRAERAKLLGYPDHATYVLADETAGTPEAVNRILTQLAPAALANAKKEADEIQKQIDLESKALRRKKSEQFKLQPWDWAYYSEQVRKARYSFDEAEVKPYFELESVLQNGVFYAAHELYGISFKERKDLPVYQSDVRVFEVTDADGSPIGLFLADYYARDNKQGGAWMNSYVVQSQLFNRKPVVSNNLNIAKPAPGEPTLLTFDEVTTMFHEFGHALHGLFSNVRYPSLAGTSVPRDFVEYPSQYNEMWARDPKVLANYAKHYQTGAPLPQALLDKVLAAQKFNQGFKTTEYLAAAMLDQDWHQIVAEQAPPASNVMAFEAAALRQSSIDVVPPRYHTPYFSHVFAGGYSAGYYAYLWSEILARDTEHWFNTHGGLTRQNGDELRAKILSRGRSADPRTLFQAFYGGPPDVQPLLDYRGLTLPPPAPAKPTKLPKKQRSA